MAHFAVLQEAKKRSSTTKDKGIVFIDEMMIRARTEYKDKNKRSEKTLTKSSVKLMLTLFD